MGCTFFSFFTKFEKGCENLSARGKATNPKTKSMCNSIKAQFASRRRIFVS